MNIYTIGDIHLSGNPPTKPMDVFGPHWHDHWNRIKTHWQSTVTDDDIVFLVGDMSWALRLEEALPDLQEIATMKGKKYMIRGNHDYWWSSANKMKNAMGDTITFIQGHGTAIVADTPGTNGESIIAFGGTRGYICPGDYDFNVDRDQSIYNRELLRTEAALEEMNTSINRIHAERMEQGLPKLSEKRLLLLHYPPFNENNAPSGFTDLMERYNVDICIFGHLHDPVSFNRIPTTFGNTELKLVSADYSQFMVQKIL